MVLYCLFRPLRGYTRSYDKRDTQCRSGFTRE